jgi:2-polyprenyl-3-methyl-5-hydroxy-6-metoxy-1,4-benzoquinol methylase
LGVILLDKLEIYYDEQDEDIRLKVDRAHSLEYLTTIRYLDKICHEPVSILDACAGTGAYCFDLAEKGHLVTAGDVVPANVNMIKEKQKRILFCKTSILAIFLIFHNLRMKPLM